MISITISPGGTMPIGAVAFAPVKPPTTLKRSYSKQSTGPMGRDHIQNTNNRSRADLSHSIDFGGRTAPGAEHVAVAVARARRKSDFSISTGR
jgi:hypothetical protein